MRGQLTNSFISHTLNKYHLIQHFFEWSGRWHIADEHDFLFPTHNSYEIISVLRVFDH